MPRSVSLGATLCPLHFAALCVVAYRVENCASTKSWEIPSAYIVYSNRNAKRLYCTTYNMIKSLAELDVVAEGRPTVSQ